jgi:hypothetical protein
VPSSSLQGLRGSATPAAEVINSHPIVQTVMPEHRHLSVSLAFEQFERFGTDCIGEGEVAVPMGAKLAPEMTVVGGSRLVGIAPDRPDNFFKRHAFYRCGWSSGAISGLSSIER